MIGKKDQENSEHQREFNFTDKNFNIIRNLVKEHAGISLSDAKKELVYGRLARRIRYLELNTFNEYCQLLENDEANEFGNFINAITTNLTSFFRESHHFDYLASTVLPNLIKTKADRKIRIWSAGCSTGEEPYTLSLVVLENVPTHWNVSILATDLDSNVVNKAKSGIYDRDRVKDMTLPRLKKWFKKGKGKNLGMVKVKPELQKILTFKQLNLMESWPMKERFDIIFCRNVVIYFSKDTQKVLFERYANQMTDDGHLFIGHSENLFKVTQRFDRVGPNSVYRKIK